ncbi:chromate transporter [Hydrogenophaga sp.]|uniref:chromate transporter n=1 Tax=Hydrogenophaga sp. TaxID=1904254 RepID=UPI0026341CA5|nr:chromate transporter [Hydrogenophaga sp.]MDM7950487.1 chromate transporter [Hydrogenophaga sp.]
MGAATPIDWLAVFSHFASLSLLAVGGAITTAPDMHRYLVTQQAWLSDTQFTASIALSQAAPGPNVLFIALLGWNLGLNAGGGAAAGWQAWGLALLGVVVSMTATLLPSSVLTYTATRWAHHNRERRTVRAFKAGMAPIVIALLIATGRLLTAAHDQPASDWPLYLLTATATLLVWRTRIHLLWLIGTGALLGASGWV